MSRILLATFGSLGDLHPYIAVGQALGARGHQAVIASCGDYEAAVTGAGLEFAAVPPRLDGMGDREVLTRRLFHPRQGTRRMLDEVVFPHLDAAHAAIDRAADGAQLLVGHPLTFGVPVVAQRRGLPWLSTVLAPSSFLSRHDPPRLSVDVLRRAHRLGPWAYDFMLGMVRHEVWRWEAPLRAFRARQGLPTPQIQIFEGQFSSLGTLALFDPVLGAPQADWPVDTQLCGAALHDAGGADGSAETSAALEQFLAEGEPPIVFALGSAAVWMGEDYFRSAIAATVQLQRRALLLTGKPWPEPLPAGIRAFAYLPYSRVFPRAAAVVHQAGIGTLSQALRSGRPQLITPAGFDQLDNAERASKLGLARVLPFQKVTARRLRRELAALLADAGAAQAAARVAGQLDGQGAARAAQAIEAALLGSLRSQDSPARPLSRVPHGRAEGRTSPRR
ncbi:MAG TPA: glycosyltransferase [Steroidobacteraceae bacterium]|nr:glycosyltransferase [Steroidobacteraceae bacterium]